MKFTSLNQWLFWLESQQIQDSHENMFCHVKKVAERLQLFPFPHRSIIVTGTNGKGSCVALLESIYRAAGCRIATFTSPHLFRFNERIRVKGKCVDNKLIYQMFQKIDEARGEIKLTYFQFTTLAALLIFKDIVLDLVILEVGIGGRFDPVNMIDGDISVITSVGLDHCAYLGNTREAIGREKAGIMRANRPCICGDHQPPESIVHYAKTIQAPLYIRKKDFRGVEDLTDWNFYYKTCVLKNLIKPKIFLSNVETALMAIENFQHVFPVSKEAIQSALTTAQCLGRAQLFHYHGIKILFDVAHNPDAIQLLKNKMDSLGCSGKRFSLCGMCADKNTKDILKILLKDFHEWHFVSLNHPRGAHALSLGAELSGQGCLNFFCCDSIDSAFQEILTKAAPGDLVVIWGSFMLVGAAMKYFNTLQSCAEQNLVC